MTHTLISTIYSIEPVMFCITHFSPKKIVLLSDKEPNKTQSEAIRMLNETVGKVIEIELKETAVYDVLKIAKDTVDVIWTEQGKNRDIIVNISGGRKPQALGALFGCYAHPDLVEKIVYVTEEDKNIIELPILNFGISKTKRRILEALQEDQISVKELSDKIGISRGMTYNHIRELRDMGFVERETLKITTAGRLAIID
ncbi:CRISPR-associated CARF protein Csa3 [Methanobacterium sp. ACI-7]|uniref:CRISPR-associated CARF protein Csa3 n=1 Tax=unclassified Methanobacterium TaxID=2627676 RepID=UPI0039C0F556